MLRGRKFEFSWEITLTALVLVLLCWSMAVWQFSRFRFKQVYFAQVEAQKQLGERPFPVLETSWRSWHHAMVEVEGEWEHGDEMAIINRSMHGAPGVHVVTPFRLAGSDHLLLVDRGFLPYEVYVGDHQVDYQPKGIQRISGILRPSQTPSFIFSLPEIQPANGQKKKRWLRLETEKIGEELNQPIYPVYLEQTNQTELPQAQPNAILPPSRHLNYTLQWSGFGVFTIFLALLLQLRRRSQTSSFAGAVHNS